MLKCDSSLEDRPPSTDSTNKMSPELNEIQHLKEHLNVWGEDQEVLERQALTELEIFAKENGSKIGVELEDGEVPEDNKEEKGNGNCFLDVNSYIKGQEELKKRQDYKKSLSVSAGDKAVAERVLSISKARKRKGHECVGNEGKVKRKKKSCGPAMDDSEGSEYVPSDDNDEELETQCDGGLRKVDQRRQHVERARDDGCAKSYKARLALYYDSLERLGVAAVEDFKQLDGGLKVPQKMWGCLYGYQQDGVRWLWDLHCRESGGLLGDEMGLGKTVQVIVFLAALERSKVSSCHGRFLGLGATLIVAPATVLHQWVRHFHEWAPEFRVAVLHQSGSFQGNRTRLVRDINKNNAILITTYSGVLRYKGVLADFSWHYVILDEGHKVRNPNAKVSVAVKEFRTPHRLMLTGSPMQNNLQELWSLFDFVVPGMLGTLPTFMEHFAQPIMHGGYTNATQMQEATALSVATALKELISPFLLRRSKNEVRKEIALPKKSEQVLFCSLTDEQRDLYKGYLMSEEVHAMLGKGGKNWFAQHHLRSNVLVAITTLRKICNHPDLYLDEVESGFFASDETEESAEHYKRSGKMIVVSALLKIWKKQKHRVLLFTQSCAVLAMLGRFLTQNGYTYLKMDGSTCVSSRQPLIEQFNKDATYDVFLLTTRVGGLGVNLTGADRVIIYDPDWNPATDTQARERAWRIGQEKQVTIYRLISAGTIEEKMYQRQVWKQLLSNKVLLDPRTQRFFKSSDLYDLFSLQESDAASNNPETANIFRNSRVNLQEKIGSKDESASPEPFRFSAEKLQAMKALAQQIARNMQTTPTPTVEKPKKEHEGLSPVELLNINRSKSKTQSAESAMSNQIDGSNTDLSFESALSLSLTTAKLHRSNVGKASEPRPKPDGDSNATAGSVGKNRKDKKVKVDTSGVIDGERVKGLLKTEIKSRRLAHNESQDDYVLEKLFSKKGVHTALQHDVIVQSGCKEESRIKIHWEAQQRTDVALQALRKSRLNNWRW